jgi:uncharacterized protein YoxC
MEKLSDKARLEKLEKAIAHVSKSIEQLTQSIQRFGTDTDRTAVTSTALGAELGEIGKVIDEIWSENERSRERLVSRTVSLMHQRRKAAEDVDDRYFEQELYIEAHEAIAEMLLRHKAALASQAGLLSQWAEST